MGEIDADIMISKRIFFGHHSVGQNIIEGIMENYSSLGINIVNSGDIPENRGCLMHASVGVNKDPLSKMRSFQETLSHNALGDKIDIAFFKFCFVDINKDTDVESLFIEYKNLIEGLKENYPDLTLVHLTVPVTQEERGLKPFIKKIVGKELWDTSANVKRELYNKELRSVYAGIDPIFDLAMWESTEPDGKRSHAFYRGKEYYYLFSGYTEDGGHLNELGRRVIAGEFIKFLNGIK